MSRSLFGVEKGLRIFEENSDIYIDQLAGQTAPDGLGDQAAAPIGSVYFRIGTAEIYQKETNVGNADDWVLNGAGSSSVLPIFSNKVVRAATGDVVAAGTVDVTAFSDNESGLSGAAFSVGEYLIGGVGGTPLLFLVDAVTSPTDITVSAAIPAMVDNDGYIVRSYLPDSPGNQENTAGVMYQSGNIVKLFDIDWSLATAISVSAGYSAVNGTVAIGNSVEEAIEKLDGNQLDLTTLSGVSQGSTDLGSFTGVTISDAQNTKQALQELESDHEVEIGKVANLVTLSGQAVNSVNHGLMDQGEVLSDNATTNALFKEVDAELTRQKGKVTSAAVTTITTVDSVLVDEVAAFHYMITVENVGAPSSKKHFEFFAGHDGHAAADAAGVDDTLYARLKLGANFNVSISADINGTGAGQEMRLRVASTEPGGVNVYATRVENLF